MRHKESFVGISEINNSDNIENLIKGIGNDYYEENIAEPVEIIKMFIKEDINLEYLIKNKVVKNVLTDVETYGLEYFIYCQFSEQVENEIMDNFTTCLTDIHGVFGLFVYTDETSIFINDELIDSIYLGNDNKIYYLTEEENIYSYVQKNHTVSNKCNKYPA